MNITIEQKKTKKRKIWNKFSFIHWQLTLINSTLYFTIIQYKIYMSSLNGITIYFNLCHMIGNNQLHQGYQRFENLSLSTSKINNPDHDDYFQKGSALFKKN